MSGMIRGVCVSPGVFDVHGDSGADSEVADGPGFRQAADFRDFQVHCVGGLVCHYLRQNPCQTYQSVTHYVLHSACTLTDVVHALVQDDRKGTQPPHGETLVVGQAGLLDVDVQVLHRVHHSHRLVHLPARVGVAH